MNQFEAENNIMKWLPKGRQLWRDALLLVGMAAILGPLIGPPLVALVNPSQAWGVAGDYSLGSVLSFGLAFLMVELFFYTGWLMSRARRGYDEREADDAWWNKQQ